MTSVSDLLIHRKQKDTLKSLESKLWTNDSTPFFSINFLEDEIFTYEHYIYMCEYKIIFLFVHFFELSDRSIDLLFSGEKANANVKLR